MRHINMHPKSLQHRTAAPASSAWLQAAFLTLLLAALPFDAFAATSIGGIFCTVLVNIIGIPPFISLLTYITGIWFAARGGFDLIKRTTDKQIPLYRPILSVCVGASIAGFTHFVGWIYSSIYSDAQTGGAGGGCTATDVAVNTTPVGLDQVLVNFVTNIQGPIIFLLSALCTIFGAIMIFVNMIKLAKFNSDAKSSAFNPIVFGTIIGALLMSVGHTLGATLSSIFGTATLSTYSTINYQPQGSFSMVQFDHAMGAVFNFLSIIGAIAFVQGLFVLRQAIEGVGQATKGQAFTHIIGGALLVNMPGFIHAIENTTGFAILSQSGS